MKQTEAEKFLDGIKGDEQANLDAPAVEVPVKDIDPEEVPESIKNRQHRRLEQRLQAQREENIALNERLKAKEEFQQNIVRELPVDDRLKRLFGSDEKGLEISKHFTEILNEYKGSARTEAIKELKEELAREKQQEEQEVASYETKIESGLEEIEDEFGVDLTSTNSAKSRKEFLDFVTKIAPKDEDGSPIELPDLVGAYEIFKESKAAPKSSRRTEIASRSMQSSGQANIKQEQISEEEHWMRQQGYIK